MNLDALVASLSPRRPLLLVETETVRFATSVVELSTVLGQFISVDEFACDSKSCAPPPIGTGGSRSTGSSPYAEGAKYAGGGKGTIGAGSRKIGAEEHERDMRTLGFEAKEKEFLNRKINDDGTFGIPEMTPASGGRVDFTPKREKSIAKSLTEKGLSHEILVANLVEAGRAAIEKPTAMHDAAWYTREHEWAAGLSSRHSVDLMRVLAATSVASAARKWGNEGVGTSPAHTNKGCIETLLKKLADDEPFEVTQAMADEFNSFDPQATRKIGYGTKIEPGIYRPSELSSVSLARLSKGLGWKVVSQTGVVPIAQAIAVLRGELQPNDVILGMKQRSFVSNLLHPEIDYTSTNDVWHLRAALGDNLFEVLDNRVGPDGERLAPKGTKVMTTIKDYESWITGYKTNEKGKRIPHRANNPQKLLTGGPPFGGLYNEVTKATHDALQQLKASDPRFSNMKMHEFQALVWKFVGGNSDAETGEDDE